ncbi:MAG: M23 family metallopeptidase [Planctomycetota bacterium]
MVNACGVNTIRLTLAAATLLALSACGGPEPKQGTPGLTVDTIDLFDPARDGDFDRASPALTEEAPPVYKVSKGDTLFALSWRYGITVDKIRLLNNLTTNALKAGQLLRLREGKPAVAAPPVKTTPVSVPEPAVDAFDFGELPAITRTAPPPVPGEDPPPARPRVGSVSTKGYQWPVSGQVALEYAPGSDRPGIEISAAEGEAVVAARDGEVIFRGYLPGLGNTVVIEHAMKYITLYGYLGRVTANCGDKVMRGKVIGTVGTSGACRTPRLHFRVYVNFGDAIAPRDILP